MVGVAVGDRIGDNGRVGLKVAGEISSGPGKDQGLNADAWAPLTVGLDTHCTIASPKAQSRQLGALLDRSWCEPADATFLSGGLPGMVAKRKKKNGQQVYLLVLKKDLRESTDEFDPMATRGWLPSSGTLIFRLLESEPPRLQNNAFL